MTVALAKPAGFDRMPRVFEGATVAVLGGGPSLTKEQVTLVSVSGCKVLAVNDAGYLAPWAELLWFCDERWALKHLRLVERFSGRVATLENLKLRSIRADLICLRNMGIAGFHPEPDGLRTGSNSGYQAIHAAVHAGARRILLLGFDMKASGGRTHWHEGHPWPGSLERWSREMLPHFPGLAAALAERGVEVVNCTPGSALDAWPKRELERCL